jgi:hypothetical protein
MTLPNERSRARSPAPAPSTPTLSRHHNGGTSLGSVGPLRKVIEDAAAESGMSMKGLTVLSAQADPYRLDVPAMHRDGRWLAETATTLGLGDRQIHLRGLHYMILGQAKPDGSQYVSDDDSWTFLETAAKSARWLGYIPFDQIIDQRNAAPVVRIWTPPQPEPYITVGIEVELPDADEIEPTLEVADFWGTQPYKIVMVGEKSSLDVVLGPIAEAYHADLYLPTGDISDTMVYRIASTGSADARRMVVLYFADADPAGWNMSIVVGRKLQAFKDLLFRTSTSRSTGSRSRRLKSASSTCRPRR